MAENIKNAILQKKIEGIIYDLMIRTNSENVIMADGRTLATTFADYLTETQVNESIDQRISEIINGAPAAYDTLKEIADYIDTHEDTYAALQTVIGDKVNKEDGKGLSTEDFTTELKEKLEDFTLYVHPETHSAEMIVETDDRKFITLAEKQKIEESGRIIFGNSTPGDLRNTDLFLQIIE